MNVLVLLNYNDYDRTRKLVCTIEDYQSIDQIVIVDNNSTDCSMEVLSRLESKKVTLIQSGKNGGYAFGNNFGIKYSLKHFLVSNFIICNPDVEFGPDELDALVYLINSSDDIALITGLINNQENNVVSNFAWKVPKYYDLVLSCFQIYYKVRRLLGLSIFYNYKKELMPLMMEVEVVPGCFFIIKKNAIVDVNYFDVGTFLFHEENILGFKLKEKGYHSYVYTKANISHFHVSNPKKKMIERIRCDKILLNSANHYLKNYLKCNDMKIFLYKLCFWFSRFELYMYAFIRLKFAKKL
ncbi:MAG: glycosyltransferase family 2 protein [Erysipelotrichia bacterium]|nr:glycosyltransferase family 2 protein [Erysipelotrichia bacterium]